MYAIVTLDIVQFKCVIQLGRWSVYHKNAVRVCYKQGRKSASMLEESVIVKEQNLKGELGVMENAV